MRFGGKKGNSKTYASYDQGPNLNLQLCLSKGKYLMSTKQALL